MQFGHDLGDLPGRGNGITGEKSAARRQRPFRDRFVALEQFHPALVEVFSQCLFSRIEKKKYSSQASQH